MEFKWLEIVSLFVIFYSHTYLLHQQPAYLPADDMQCLPDCKVLFVHILLFLNNRMLFSQRLECVRHAQGKLFSLDWSAFTPQAYQLVLTPVWPKTGSKISSRSLHFYNNLLFKYFLDVTFLPIGIWNFVRDSPPVYAIHMAKNICFVT